METRTLTIAAVGDIMLDRRMRPPRTFFHHPDFSTCGGAYEGQLRFPFPNNQESIGWLASLDRHVHGIKATSHAMSSLRLELPEEARAHDYPFRKVSEALRSSQIVFGNLECPLSTRGRRLNNDTCYSAHPGFAAAMAEAGFNVLSFANNHCFDYGEVAFHDTLEALKQSGIRSVGAGSSLRAARVPAVFEENGVRVAFLAYTLVGPHWIYATDDESGAAPLNPMIVGQDIRAVRDRADVVVLSLHWGTELRAVPAPRMVDLAHDFIDAGADVILGHHPHVAGAVEVHRGRPIFYSLGNFSFGHDHAEWGSDMLVRLHVERGALARAEILTLSGRFQPEVTNGDVSAAFHRRLTEISRPFGTAIASAHGVGTIELTQ